MKNIIVIGGGTAGWLTALSVNKFWKDASVTLIESSAIGILGAGEGSTPNFGAFLSLLEINQNDFFKRTGCTSKI
jgi:tryptophan halogenase